MDFLTAMRKDSPSVDQVHVSTAIGNEDDDALAALGQIPNPKVPVVEPEERGPATNATDADVEKIYSSVKELPKGVKGSKLIRGSKKKLRQFMHVVNSILHAHPRDEARAFSGAWSTVQKVVSKSTVGYEDQATGGKYCSQCAHFDGPNECTKVVGPINPIGWCELWLSNTVEIPDKLRKTTWDYPKDMNVRGVNVDYGPPRPLFVKRPLLNGEALRAWAKSQGFETTLDPKDMHVTLMYSKTPVDWATLDPPQTWVETVPAVDQSRSVGPLYFNDCVSTLPTRVVQPLGPEGAIVLRFDHQPFLERNQALQDQGAVWEHPNFKAHVSISYGEVPGAVEPYTGALVFGPEEFAEADPDWRAGYVEKRDGPKVGDIVRVESDSGSIDNAPWESEVIWADGWNVKVKYDDGETIYHLDPSNLDDVDGLGKEDQHLWFFTKKEEILNGEPMVGVGGRRLEPFDDGTLHVPFRYDPAALSYLNPDQVPFVLDAVTHPEKLDPAWVNLDDLVAVKGRVGRDTVQKHLDNVDDLELPVVGVINGVSTILDGHDRLAAMWLNGDDQVPVYCSVIPFDSKRKPDPDVQHEGSRFDLLRGEDGRALANYQDGTLSIPFRYDPAFFSHLRPDQVPKFLFAITHPDDLEEQDVPLDGLTAIQDRVNADTVADKVENGYDKLPVVVRMNGADYIGDGHDRLSSDWLKGKTTVPVRRVDITHADNRMKPTEIESRKSFTVKVSKADPDKQQIFGWASVVTKGGEPVVDKQQDIIDPEELEKAAYDYVLNSRDGGWMHETTGVMKCIESMIFSEEKQKALGIDLGQISWWVGFQVTDPAVWAAVKDGSLPEFSIGGTAVSRPV